MQFLGDVPSSILELGPLGVPLGQLGLCWEGSHGVGAGLVSEEILSPLSSFPAFLPWALVRKTKRTTSQEFACGSSSYQARGDSLASAGLLGYLGLSGEAAEFRGDCRESRGRGVGAEASFLVGWLGWLRGIAWKTWYYRASTFTDIMSHPCPAPGGLGD